jgi:hypothetical protein
LDRIYRINRMKKGRARTEGTENAEEEAWKGLGLIGFDWGGKAVLILINARHILIIMPGRA